jgi:hypothetical protein
METELVSATSALERPVTVNPAESLAILIAAIRAANDLNIFGIEIGGLQVTLLRRCRISLILCPEADTELTS